MKNQQNEIKVFHSFLEHYKIIITNYDLKKRLIGYDSFPSLPSLIDFFRLEKIPFSIFQYTNTADLPNMFLTYLNINDRVFLSFVKKKKDFFLAHIAEQKITFRDTEINKLMIDYIIVVEKQPSYNYYFKTIRNYLEDKIIYIFLLSIAIISMIKSEESNFFMVLLPLLGGITSFIFILKKNGSLILQNICTTNRIDTCKKIQDIKFLNIIDISVLSISYFITQLLFVCIPNPNLYSDLYFFAILSLGSVFFSVYYQVFKIKSICLLCSIINTTLLALFFYLLRISDNYISFNAMFLIILIGVYSISHIVYAKSLLKKENLNLRKYLNSFQSNPDIFSTYKENSRNIVNSNLNFSKENSLIFIINPDCNSCKDLLKEFKNIIIKSSLNIEIKYNLFYDSSDNEYRKASILLKLYHENKASFFRYIEKEDSIIVPFNIAENEQRKIDQILKNDLNWCKLNQIVGAPGMVINSVLFPIHKYEFNYLRLLIEDYFEEDY